MAENSNTPFERVVHVVGQPHNYGLSAAEKAALASAEAQRQVSKEIEEEKAREEGGCERKKRRAEVINRKRGSNAFL